jgi:FAD dependent oxidoreductase TIGR03364
MSAATPRLQQAQDGFDVVVLGAGIVGLAHAWSAARRGLSVAVVERDARCVGASIRNFGFVTVTGQAAGDTWRRARRSRDLWDTAAAGAGITVVQRGAWITARRAEARVVLEAFAAGPMGDGCRLLEGAAARARSPVLHPSTQAVLVSPHELRVESRDALPRLAAWLARAHGVHFFWQEDVLEVAAPAVRTSRRTLRAERVVLCPGAALTGVAAPWLAPYGLRLTRLQMLRLRPAGGARLPATVLGDLSLARYGGFAALPEAAALKARLADEVPDALAHGIHVIAAPGADGDWVVGDSHHDDQAADPFGPTPSEAVDAVILRELQAMLHTGTLQVTERWTGHYPVGHTEDRLVHAEGSTLRVVVVTSGTGASTAFAIADEVFDAWC